MALQPKAHDLKVHSLLTGRHSEPWFVEVNVFLK
jgi:hypothetical protein